MVYTDHPITGYVFPQDSGMSGIANSDADWANAAYIGGLGLAEASNYAPKGLGLTADHANESFTIGDGVAYIEDDTTIDFRDWDDSEQTHSGTWGQGFLSLYLIKSQSNIPFQTTSGTNYVWVYYTHSSQNDTYLRVADTSSDAPTQPSLKIAEIDASSDSQRETNRVSGHNWNYIGKYEANGANSITINVPEAYDEMKLKFIGVTGSDESRARLRAQVNGTPSYYQRTTQGSNQQITYFWANHDVPSRAEIHGELRMNGRWDTTWSFDNRLTNRAGEYFATSGWNDNVVNDGTLNEIWMEWAAGTITGEWALWGRDYV